MVLFIFGQHTILTESASFTDGRLTWFAFFSPSVQQIDVSFSCIWPVIDHEFRHNVVKIAVDPQSFHNRYFVYYPIVKNHSLICFQMCPV